MLFFTIKDTHVLYKNDNSEVLTIQHQLSAFNLMFIYPDSLLAPPLAPTHTGDNGVSSLARTPQTLFIILYHNASQLLEERLWDPVTIVQRTKEPYVIIHDYRPNFQKETQEESKTHYIYCSLSWLIFHLIQ